MLSKQSPFFLITILLVIACGQNTKKSTSEEDRVPYLTKERAQQLDSLDILLSKKANEDILPGFAVSIFSKDTVFLSRGYGLANMEEQRHYDPQTVQSIASVSKTLIAVALMKAVEDGKVALDHPINNYLPFPVNHPKYPDIPITLRHLATHSSGITDEPNGGKGNIFSEKLKEENWREVWHPIIAEYNTNTDKPMKQFLFDIFSEKVHGIPRKAF
ncbi:MAG: beta-lactamase family protein [Flavobacteriaceae bacterium]|nr:beta-lactamase family protein [Flavobacteriaceae bacterium]